MLGLREQICQACIIETLRVCSTIQVLTFENTDIYVSNQNFFIGPDLPNMLAKTTLFSEYDAAVKVLKSGSM